MRKFAHRIVHSRRFEYLLVVLIAGSSALQGVGTQFDVGPYLVWFGVFWLLTIGTLALEALCKIFALLPRAYRYFMDGWNIFDFLVISALIVGLTAYPPAADYAVLIMLVRLLRLLRGISAIKDMRTLLSTLFRSIPSAGNIAILMGIIIYAYALVGHLAFSEHDPARWGNLGAAASSLFQMVTMDEWAAIMRGVNDAAPLAWVYFFSFVIISGFVITNIFIAIIIRNLDEYRDEHPQPPETPASKEEILQELRATQQSLQRIEERMQRLPDET